MNFKLLLATLSIIGTLVCVNAEYTADFNLKNIPKGLTMIDVISSMTQSPKYLSLPDNKKLKMLNSLIFLMREVTDKQTVEDENRALIREDY
jgi:hypothetical protein